MIYNVSKLVVLMKLNNHGWGLNQMIFYCGILLFFLLIAVFFIVQLSNSLGDIFKDAATGLVTYETIESNIGNATYTYLEKYYKEDIGTGTIVVTSSNLIKYKIIDESSLRMPEEKNNCKGYSLVKREEGEIVVSPYIKCSNYETKGYQSWRLGD